MIKELVTTIVSPHSPEYDEVFALRDELLRRPLGMELKNDDLSRDFVDMIVAGKLNGKVVACLILQEKDSQTVQLRQMAVSKDQQGKGIGRALVAAAERHAIISGYERMVLHARKTAIGFYESMGYTIVSEEFFEVGIPHVKMEKAI